MLLTDKYADKIYVIITHNEQTTNGKTFVTFLACVICSYMLKQLRQYLQDNSMSMNKVYLTKKQREILQQFNAHTTIMTSLEQLLCLR